MPRKIEISHKTIIFIFVLVGLLWLTFLIRDIILEFFLALLITAVFDPFVTKLHKKGVPRSLSVIFIYVLMFGILSLSIASIVPPLVEQTRSFIVNFPNFLTKVGFSRLISDQITSQVLNQIGALPTKIAATTVSVFSNVLGSLIVFVFSFYLLSQKDKLFFQATSLFEDGKREDINNSIILIEKRIGSWSRAEMSLMVIIGLANYIGLKLLGIPFALPLAILAGMLELVPYIGPTLAAIPAVLIGFGISPVIGLAVAALAFLIQQFENYVLVPKIMQNSVGVNPIATLICLAVGARLAGVVGLLIAVPVFISVEVMLHKYFSSSKSASIKNS